MRYRLYINCFLIFVGIGLYGQSNSLDDYDYRFITQEDNSYISSKENLFVDSTGMLWLATPSSLLLYDGKSIINYSKEAAIYRVDISNFQLFDRTAEGNFIIVSSDNQFYIFNPYTKEIINQASPDIAYSELLENTLSSDQTGSIFNQNQVVPDDENGYYALLKGKDKLFYIFHSSNGSKLVFKKSFSLKGIPNLVFLEDELFLTDVDSVLQLDTDLNIIKRHSLSFSRSQTPFIFKDDERNIWAYENCTSNQCQLYKYHKKTKSFLPYILPKSLALKGIHKIRKDNGIFWFFGVGKLIQFDPDQNIFVDIFSNISKSFESLESPPLISHYTSIMSDHNNMIWLTSGYGLVQLIPKQDAYTLLLKSDPLFCNGFCSMRGIAADKEGNIWLASYSGLLRYSSDGVLSKLDELDKYLLDGIYSLSIQDPYLLVNDLLYNMKTAEVTELILNKQNRHVTNTIGANNDFWISTCYADGNQIGLYNYNLSTSELTTIDIPKTILQSGQITDLEISKDKKSLWMTTALSGSLEFNIETKQFKSITPSQYWVTDNIRHFCIYETNENQLFIGTSRSILEVDLSSGLVKEHRKLDDLEESNINRNIFSILPETDSVLWLGSDKGILNFNTQTKRFSSFSEFGKLGTEEFNRESSYKSDQGELFFGSVNGVYILEAKHLKKDKKIYGKNINLISTQYYDGNTNRIIQMPTQDEIGHKIRLQHHDKMVSVRVSIPDFRQHLKTYYSYSLEGFQDSWSIPNEENIIRFTNLDPGDYTLRVKGGHDINNLNSNVMSIDLEVSDAWYNTIWFKLLMLALLVAILFFFFSIRYTQLLKYQQLRSEISKNLHDDVGTMLTGIAMQSEMLEKIADDKNKDIARSIALRSRAAMSSMRDTVWAIDSRKDTTMDLKDRILDYIQDTLYPKDISYSIKSNITTSQMKIMPHIRQNMYLIAKESINNIVKHSNTEKVEITLNVNKKSLALIIKDFGSLANLKSSGQGLTNMKGRAKALGGTYKFEYDDGYKTTVFVPLKL